jgi:hypothetical protein
MLHDNAHVQSNQDPFAERLLMKQRRNGELRRSEELLNQPESWTTRYSRLPLNRPLISSKALRAALKASRCGLNSSGSFSTSMTWILFQSVAPPRAGAQEHGNGGAYDFCGIPDRQSKA